MRRWTTDELAAIAAELRSFSGVEEVRDGQDDIERLTSLFEMARIGGSIAALVLCAGAAPFATLPRPFPPKLSAPALGPPPGLPAPTELEPPPFTMLSGRLSPQAETNPRPINATTEPNPISVRIASIVGSEY